MDGTKRYEHWEWRDGQITEALIEPRSPLWLGLKCLLMYALSKQTSPVQFPLNTGTTADAVYLPPPNSSSS